MEGVAVGPVDVASCLSICSHFGASGVEVVLFISRWKASGDWNCADGLGAGRPVGGGPPYTGEGAAPCGAIGLGAMEVGVPLPLDIGGFGIHSGVIPPSRL